MDAAGNAGGGLAVWFFPIVSAGRCPVPSCKRKSLSGLIVGRAFVLSGGLIVGVRVVLSVLLPVLRRGVVLPICA